MHPWIKIFTDYILQQLPQHHGLVAQQAIVIVQQFCDYNDFNNIDAACQFLSQLEFVTISGLGERDTFVSNDLTCIDVGRQSACFVLACELFQKSNELYLKDSTGELVVVTSKRFQPSYFNQPLFLMKWRFVSTRKTKQNETVGDFDVKDEMFYMEIGDVFCPHQQIDGDSQDIDYMSISRFISSYRQQKHNYIEGIVVSQSPLYRVPNSAPFFFLQLQCRESPQSVVVIIQGDSFAFWHSCIRLYKLAKLSMIKRTVVKKGTEEKKILFCNAKDSTLQVIDYSVEAITIKRDINFIDFEGEIIETDDAEFGIYRLEGGIKLLYTHAQPSLGKGFRCGTKIKIFNAHKIKHPCVASSHPFDLRPSELCCRQYLWLVETVKKVVCVLKRNCGENRHVNKHIKNLLDTFRTHSYITTVKRNVISEFVDTPHSCFVTDNGRNTPGDCSQRHLFTVDELQSYITDIRTSPVLEWYNGMEFDEFANYQNPLSSANKNRNTEKWLYARCKASSKMLCGKMKIMNNTNKMFICDSTSSILLYSLHDLSAMNGRVVLLNDFHIIIERFQFTELYKMTGITEEKEYYREYIYLPNTENIVVVDQNNINMEVMTSDDIGGCGSADDGVASKRQKLDENGLRALTGFIISREFKRNQNSSHDVERHAHDTVYVPKLGKRDEALLAKYNFSLYPFTTSVIVLRIQDEATHKIHHVYIDSNTLYHPSMLYPSAKVSLLGLQQQESKKTSSTFYTVTDNSRLVLLQEPLFSHDQLSDFMDKLKDRRASLVQETVLARTVQRALEGKPNVTDRHNNKQLIIARITFVQAILVKWQCLSCHGDVVNEGQCDHGCHGDKKFSLEGRFVIDDGTAECYVILENELAKKQLNFSTDVYELLKSTSKRYGKISYHRKSGSKTFDEENIHRLRKQDQCEYALYKKALDTDVRKYYQFICRSINRMIQNTGYQTVTFMNGLTEFHTLTHPRMYFQCIDYQHVDYSKLATKLKSEVWNDT